MNKYQFFSELDCLYRAEKDAVETRLLSIVRFLPFLVGITAYLFTEKPMPLVCCKGEVIWYNLFLIVNISLVISCVVFSVIYYLRPSKVSYHADVPTTEAYWDEITGLNDELDEKYESHDHLDTLVPSVIKNAARNEAGYLSDLKKLNQVRVALICAVMSYLPLAIVLFATA